MMKGGMRFPRKAIVNAGNTMVIVAHRVAQGIEAELAFDDTHVTRTVLLLLLWLGKPSTRVGGHCSQDKLPTSFKYITPPPARVRRVRRVRMLTSTILTYLQLVYDRCRLLA